MEVFFHSEDIEFEFDKKDYLIQWFNILSNVEEVVLDDINLIFCSSEYLLEINKKYLGHDYYTDVITFDYAEDGIIGGDIFIDIETVKSNAVTYEVVYELELLRVIIHGVLHLCGYKDKTPDEITEMRAKEEQYLKLYHQEVLT